MRVEAIRDFSSVSRSAEAASPYKILVTPGDTRIPRGADQTVSATLEGFTAVDVSVMMRTPGAEFERVPLVPTADKSGFEAVIFHIEKPTEYYVEANGVRSPSRWNSFRIQCGRAVRKPRVRSCVATLGCDGKPLRAEMPVQQSVLRFVGQR